MGSGRLSEPDIKQENMDVTAISREQWRLMRNETRRYSTHKERWRQNLRHTRGLRTNTSDPVTRTLPAATIGSAPAAAKLYLLARRTWPMGRDKLGLTAQKRGEKSQIAESC